MKKFPYFKCLLPIKSNKDIHEVAKIISDKLFGGLPFGGLDDYIYEEVPAVYINPPILGLEAVIQGFGGEKGYTLEVHSYPGNPEPDDSDEVHVDITGYVATLIEETEELKIVWSEKIKNANYIEIE
ncbi:hypothetical protein HOO54_05400 [Bacillus sp. WMMC1349]|uniref:hypothetical protein n=1 Tax=Bacillus sp. WMMC1349 TaxID=2736254 RepID=UPI00155191B4|nr:hypothetical protein [Bacillus sp. WMMC1349]NPC91687.1 hypothetical protein [Bacillus sp. WMMC1349]